MVEPLCLAGVITGRANPPSDPTHEHGFIFIGSKYTFFSRPGWDNTEPRAIANSGLITGFNFNGPASDLESTASGASRTATPFSGAKTPPPRGRGCARAGRGSVSEGRALPGHLTSTVTRIQG